MLYTGTHDNATCNEDYHTYDSNKRISLRRFFKNQGYSSRSFNEMLCQYALDTDADTVILPIWDICGFKEEARINTPGTVSNKNWTWKLKDFKTFPDKLMSTKEGLTKIFEYTLMRLLDAGERKTIIQFVTGLRTSSVDDAYLHCLYGYSLPARILWYDFNPRNLPVYAVKVQKGTFDAPLKLNLFDPQKDFTNTCLDGIAICGNEHYPVLGNTDDMKTWVKIFPELQGSYKADTLSKNNEITNTPLRW